MLQYKDQIFELVTLLIDGTKSERGFTGTGRLITRLLHTVSAIYSTNNRLVNAAEWDSPGKQRRLILFSHTHAFLAVDFNREHNIHWGRLYEAKDVKIDWHGVYISFLPRGAR